MIENGSARFLEEQAPETASDQFGPVWSPAGPEAKPKGSCQRAGPPTLPRSYRFTLLLTLRLFSPLYGKAQGKASWRS